MSTPRPRKYLIKGKIFLNDPPAKTYIITEYYGNPLRITHTNDFEDAVPILITDDLDLTVGDHLFRYNEYVVISPFDQDITLYSDDFNVKVTDDQIAFTLSTLTSLVDNQNRIPRMFSYRELINYALTDKSEMVSELCCVYLDRTSDPLFLDRFDRIENPDLEVPFFGDNEINNLVLLSNAVGMDLNIIVRYGDSVFQMYMYYKGPRTLITSRFNSVSPSIEISNLFVGLENDDVNVMSMYSNIKQIGMDYDLNELLNDHKRLDLDHDLHLIKTIDLSKSLTELTDKLDNISLTVDKLSKVNNLDVFNQLLSSGRFAARQGFYNVPPLGSFDSDRVLAISNEGVVFSSGILQTVIDRINSPEVFIDNFTMDISLTIHFPVWVCQVFNTAVDPGSSYTYSERLPFITQHGLVIYTRYDANQFLRVQNALYITSGRVIYV